MSECPQLLDLPAGFRAQGQKLSQVPGFPCPALQSLGLDVGRVREWALREGFLGVGGREEAVPEEGGCFRLEDGARERAGGVASLEPEHRWL